MNKTFDIFFQSHIYYIGRTIHIYLVHVFTFFLYKRYNSCRMNNRIHTFHRIL